MKLSKATLAALLALGALTARADLTIGVVQPLTGGPADAVVVERVDQDVGPCSDLCHQGRRSAGQLRHGGEQHGLGVGRRRGGTQGVVDGACDTRTAGPPSLHRHRFLVEHRSP